MKAPSRLIPRLAGLTVVVVGLSLCAWQLRRDGERNEDREAALRKEDAPSLGDDEIPAGGDALPDGSAAWVRVAWSGHYVPGAVLESARSEDHERGYGLLQLFARDRGGSILVDRGWVAVDATTAAVAAADADLAPRLLVGQLRPLPPRGDFPSFTSPGGATIWPPEARGEVAGRLGATVPLHVVAGGADGARTTDHPAADGFTVVPERDDTSLHYASQWFAIAGVGMLLLVVGKIPGIGKTAEAGKSHLP